MTVFHQDDQYAGQRRLINLDGNHRITAIMRINSTAACTPIHEIPRVKIVQPLPGVSVCSLLYCNLIFLQELLISMYANTLTTSFVANSFADEIVGLRKCYRYIVLVNCFIDMTVSAWRAQLVKPPPKEKRRRRKAGSHPTTHGEENTG